MQQKIVSIIIPVYNAEKHIYECLNSLFNQSFGNLEIILVNDGSTDHSLDILEKYKLKYPNIIKIFSQNNSGASEARNTGLDHVSGDYVTFIDIDDYVGPTYIEDLVNALTDDADSVICGYTRIVDGKVKDIVIPEDTIWSQFKYSATCGILYRAHLIKSLKLKYKDFILGEDLLFWLTYSSHTRKINVLKKGDYYYKDNPGSLTNSMKSDLLIDADDLLDQIKKDVNLKKYNVDMVMYFMIKLVTQFIIMQTGANPVAKMNKLFIKNYKKISNDYKIHMHNEESEKLLINLIVNMFIIARKLRLSFLLIATIKTFKLYKMY